MTDKNKLRAFYAVIYLISCELNGMSAKKDLISDIQASEIYSAAASCSLDSILAAALERIGITSNKASERKLLSIRKSMLFDSARAEMFSRFEEEKIKYMPLKGVIIKDLYPSVGLRQMADNDILFDKDRRKDVRNIMLSLGYTVKSYGKSNHDVYMKEPVLNFEMHTSLFAKYAFDVFSNYYGTVWDKVLKDDNNNYGYHLSDNDFYIYIKTHEYKHFSGSGTGLRSLVDTYVYLRANGEGLDFNYISEECEKMNFSEYERASRFLSEKIFSTEISESLLEYANGKCDSPLSEEEEKLLSEYLFIGTYGTEERHMRSSIEKEKKNTKTKTGAKIKYLLRLIFPPMGTFVSEDLEISKKRYLYPLFWLKRAFRILFTKPVKVLKKIGRILTSKKDKN